MELPTVDPGVLGWDSLLSLCPGTTAGANVLGQTPLSHDKTNHVNLCEKIAQSTSKRITCTCKLLVFPSAPTFRCMEGFHGTGRPIVPLSRDKKIFLSQCPFVPGEGQEQMSWDKLLCPGTSQDKMNRFPVFGHHFPVLEHHFPVLEQCSLF